MAELAPVLFWVCFAVIAVLSLLLAWDKRRVLRHAEQEDARARYKRWAKIRDREAMKARSARTWRWYGAGKKMRARA